jgi:hypothetical protein
MLSTLDNSQHDRRDVLEISPDVVLVARAAADFPTLAPEAMGREAHMDADAEMPRVDTTFRASDTSGQRSSHGKWLRRAALTFLFAFVGVFATAAWDRYGGRAQAMLTNYTPEFSLASLMPTSLFSGRAAVAAQPSDTAAPQAADQPVAADNAAPSAAVASDSAQLLQSMARDVASLNQQLTELKASIAQLKAGQDQLSRDMAKAPEARVSDARPAEPHPAPARLGAPPRPLGTLVTPVHRPKPPSYPPAQAAYVPPPPPAASAPVQIAPQATTTPEGESVVRPPMPVR